MKIFGREPAAIVGLIEATLVLALSFGLLGFVGLRGQNDIAIVMAVVSSAFGIYLAYVTSETLLAPVVGFAKAAISLGAVYGLTLTTEQTGAVIAFLTLAIGFWQRDRVAPLDRPTFKTIRPDATVPNSSVYRF